MTLDPTKFSISLGGRRWARFGFALALLGFLGACASSSDRLGFTKVKYYHLKDEDRRAESMSIDPMLRFERQHYLHGAVTMEEKQDRLGHYYTMFWNGDPAAGPVTLRFDYRQSRSGERVHRLQLKIEDVRDRNQTRFRITGDPYHQNGRVSAWEATLLQGGSVLDSTRSFLWD